MGKVELLAPAGSYESFLGAIHAGADAVYLGGSKFGARAFAENFTEDKLCQAIKYAHLFNRKVYLTLNTLLKEQELEEVYDYLLPLYNAGLDGIIIQDIGVFSYVKRHFPDLPLHVSTQMTVTGPNAAKMLKESGAVRIVPAREVSLEEIKQIKESTGLEIEVFIHGAMCYCYSGQCLFSSIIGGRSGNRGKCAQPCRLPYEVVGEKESNVAYPLSLKDMCTIEHIPALIEAGIDSFKIEGRMKKPEYAAGVTAIYRKYIDRYYKNPKGKYQVDKEDLRQLEALYIRSEIQDGYMYKHNGKEMVTFDKPSYSGSDEKLLQQIQEKYLTEELKLDSSIYAYFKEGMEAVVTMNCQDICVSINGDVVQGALKQPVTEANIRDNLSKLGNTPFRLTEITVDADDTIFYSLKAINELRRRAVEELEEKLLEKNAEKTMHRIIVHKEQRKTVKADNSNLHRYYIGIKTKEQLDVVLQADFPVKRLYLDCDICATEEEWKKLLAKLTDKEAFIAMPYIVRKRDERFLEKIYPILNMVDGCLFRNMETYQYLKDKGYKGKLCSDAGIYMWNTETLDYWKDKISSFCLPYELNKREQKYLVNKGVESEQVIYGYLPMMVTANCVVNTMSGCSTANETVYLKDRYQKKFPVYTNCKHCYNVIYNSVPLSLHGKVEKEVMECNYRLDFTMENDKEVLNILEFFHPIKRERVEPPYKEYTTGHEKRGVE